MNLSLILSFVPFDLTPKLTPTFIRIKLDREKYPSINIVVLAKDGAEEPLIATATVVITLLDENDNDPIFPQALYEANVKNTLQVSHCFCSSNVP